MSEHVDNLMSLHTMLIDTRNGYQEALEDAEGKGLTPFFEQMIAMHGKDAEDIAQHLTRLGVPVDDSGSYMTTVNRAMISLRSLFTGLDESILPGLIDGEERVLAAYDRAIASSSPGQEDYVTLTEQREALRQTITGMKRRQSLAA
jgi:uncharacterized protein (TIGR02284 family)